MKFSCRLKATSRYLTLCTHLREVLFMVIFQDLGLCFLLNNITIVFEVFTRKRYFSNHTVARQICLCNWIMAMFYFLLVNDIV